MELKRFNSEGEMSSIRFSCGDEAVCEVKNLFFEDQLDEEHILLNIYSTSTNSYQRIDLNRLNINYVFSKKQIEQGYLWMKRELLPVRDMHFEFSVHTILKIKNEQKRLGKVFEGYYVLSGAGRIQKNQEPPLFVKVGENVFYLVNSEQVGQDLNRDKNRIKNFVRWIKRKISSETSTK